MESVVAWVGENWVNILAWGTEFLAVLFCIHGVFGERFKVNMTIIIMIGVDIATFSLIREGILTENFTCVAYFITLIYCLFIFKKKIIEKVVCYILSIVVAIMIEIVTTYITFPLEKYIQWEEVLILVMNGLSLFLAFTFFSLLTVSRKKSNIKYNSKKVILVILICVLCIMFMLLDYRYRGEMDQIYYLIFIGLVIGVCFYWIKTEKVQFELEKKNLELEMQEVYGAAYKELIFEVRRKQHDFRNQLGAVYSMHLTATSLEDLIEKQRKYGEVLLTQDCYDKILTGCNNPILAGYLYNKCVGLEKSNVVVEHKIHVNRAECNLSLHEVIEILGILITNAVENILGSANGQKMIELVVEENGKNLTIEVSNWSKYLTSGEIEKIFDRGYSSKGENRGIGLARMKQLAEKSNSDIVVENYEKLQQNWIRFKIIIPKING